MASHTARSNEAFATEWDGFEASPLKRRLLDQRRLIPYEPVGLDFATTSGAHAVIRPERIEFLSYPYEWTFGELRESALLTLDIQLEAMGAGWTLKDASAFNIQFHEGRPIHIDSSSFEPLEEGAPWVAYRQFCEQFLAPLALVGRRDVRLSDLLRVEPDGIPLDLASRLLPRRTWFDFGLLSHVHLHARAQLRHAASRRRWTCGAAHPHPAGPPGGGDPESALDRRCARLATQAGRNGLTTPSTRATASGRRRTRTALSTGSCASCRDGACGTSARTPVASAGSRPTRASESSPSTSIRPLPSDTFAPSATAGRTDILPLVVDIANPTPALGWAGRERRSLLERADADAILALALVHHLAITRNVPLPMVLDLFADLAPWAIVEFVPKDDPMVRRLLATRRDVFADYDLDSFRAAAGTRFEIVREEPIADSTRVLFLLRRR